MTTNTFKNLRHDQIRRSLNNVRTAPGDCEGLADSIAGVGLIQPMIVRKDGDLYELIAGERRWTAIGLLIESGRAAADFTWPTIIKSKVDDAVQTASMIVENLHRQNLSHAEEFGGIVTLASEHGWSADQISTHTGISVKSVKDRMAWMAFTDEQLEMLFDKEISVDSMTQLAKLPADQIAEAFVKPVQLRYEIENVIRMAGRHKEAKRFVNKLRKAGHLVCEYDDRDTDAAAAALKTLELRCGPQEKVAVRHGNMRATEERLDEFDAGTIFFIKVTQYAVETKFAVVESTAPTDHSPEAATNDYSRDMRQAQIDFEREQKEYQAKRAEAERSFLHDSKPSELVSYVLMQTLVDVGEFDGEEDEWDNTQIAEMLEVGPDESLKAYVTKNASNMARAAAALLLSTGGSTPGDIRPAVKRWPDRTHYNEAGAYVGPPSEDAAPDGHEPPERDEFDSTEEYEAAVEVFQTHKQMLEQEEAAD